MMSASSAARALLGGVCFLLVVAVPGSAFGAQAEQELSSEQRGLLLARKMIAAYGGLERWNAVRDGSFVFRVISYHDTTGRPRVVRTRHSFTKDPQLVVRMDVGQAMSEHGRFYTQDDAWITVNGVENYASSSQKARIGGLARHAMLWVEFPFNLVAPGTQLDYLGEADVIGVDTYVLQVSWAPDRAVEPDDIHRFYVNKVTHLLLREEHFLHGRAEARAELMHGDYRSVRGILKDHLREIVSPVDGRAMQRIEVEDLRLGANLPADLFERPVPPAQIELPAE